MGEKRRFTRIRIEGHARLDCDFGKWEARLLDVSLRGALISRPEQWNGEPGQTCRVELQLGQGEVVIRMEGGVAHTGEDRVGIRCDHIDLDSLSHLKRMVELNTGDPDLLERELEELAAG